MGQRLHATVPTAIGPFEVFCRGLGELLWKKQTDGVDIVLHEPIFDSLVGDGLATLLQGNQHASVLMPRGSSFRCKLSRLDVVVAVLACAGLAQRDCEFCPSGAELCLTLSHDGLIIIAAEASGVVTVEEREWLSEIVILKEY